jgi:hypothetical protein
MNLDHRFRANETELVEALAVCLDALAIGSDLESSLEMYPTLAEKLHPLLLTAQAAQTLHPIQVPGEAMNRSRTQALTRAAVLRESRKPLLDFWGWTRRVPRLALSSIVTVVVLFAGVLSVNAAASRALPGDSLYPFKLSVENLWLNLTSGSQVRENLQTVYTQRRVDEVRQLLALGREETITFEGVLTKQELLSGIAPERWLVSDIYVLRTIDTDVKDGIEIGMLIQVEGRTRSDGYVEAYTLHPLAFAFVGSVEVITSDVWTVAGRTVGIRPETELESGIAIGSQVMVLAEFDDEANIFARAILLTGSPEELPTPTVSPTLEPPVTESPVETATLQPMPSPSQTPTPSVTPFPMPTTSPTPEASEIENGDDDDTPEPTEDETEEPDETDEPTKTDEPDDDNSGPGGGGGDD